MRKGICCRSKVAFGRLVRRYCLGGQIRERIPFFFRPAAE